MIRSILAVLAGYLICAIIVIVTVGVATVVLIPNAMEIMKTGQMPPMSTAYLVANLTCSFIAALVGGFVTAVIARRAPLAHAGALAVLFAVISIATRRAASAAPGQPEWYAMGVLGVGVVGVLAGGYIRALIVARTSPTAPA